jgi:hypothetical protein
MSPFTDQQFASDLRRRAAGTLPPMTLDVDETVRLGRRRLHTRRWTAALVAGATAAIAVIIGVSAAGSPQAITPAGQEPEAMGPNQVVTIAPGITASNGVTTARTSNGSPWWDTGLRFGPADGPSSVGLMAVGETTVPLTPASDPTSRPDGIVTAIDDPSGYALSHGGAQLLTWPFSGVPELSLSGAPGVAKVIVGTVPEWINDPHVALVFPHGVSGSDDQGTWFQIPTFADPQGSGRLLYAVVVQPPAAWNAVEGPAPAVFVVAADRSGAVAGSACGTVEGAQCLTDTIGAGEAEIMLADLSGTAPTPEPAATGVPFTSP